MTVNEGKLITQLGGKNLPGIGKVVMYRVKRSEVKGHEDPQG